MYLNLFSVDILRIPSKQVSRPNNYAGWLSFRVRKVFKFVFSSAIIIIIYARFTKSKTVVQ